jgi:ribosomal protein S18 acetylase RimI-like enzyme
MNQSVIIREATQDDLYSILQLANQLSETITISESYLTGNFFKFIDNEHHCLVVAVKNEVVVGYVSGYFHNTIYACGLVAYVDEIVVDVKHRAMKTGAALMTAFEKISKEKGCVIVSLATYGAKSFYEAHGYKSNAGYFKKYL